MAADVQASAFSKSHIARFLDIDDGLPGNFVDDIFQDSDGFLWIAMSGGGLCRYDGYDLLSLSTNSVPGLKNNFVRKLAQDRCSHLWIASEGGVDVLNLNDFSLTDLAGTPLADYCHRSCSCVEVDATGAVWMNFGSNLVRAMLDNAGAIIRTDVYTDERLSPLNQFIEDVEKDGTVWTSIAGNIYKVGINQDGQFWTKPVTPGLSFRPDAVVADYLLKDGEAWVATNDGLFRYGLRSGNWKQYTYSPENAGSISQNYVSGLALGTENQLIVCTLKGLNIYSPINDNFERLLTGGGLLSSDFINCVKIIGSDIWLGTESAGLVQISRKRLAVENYVYDAGMPESISENPVNSIYQSQDGTVWVGNVESGLNFTGNLIAGFRHRRSTPGGLSHNTVSSIIEDGGNTLWVGTWGGGVNTLKDGMWQRVVWNQADDERFSYVGTMAYDSLNNLVWIGTNYGIFYADAATRKVDALLTGNIMGCTGSAIDSEGYLWMGSQDGLYVINLKSEDGEFNYVNYRYKLDATDSKVTEKIVAVAVANDGVVWLGSNGNGIYKARRQVDGNLAFVNYSTQDGLVNDFVKCIVVDDAGDLWISTGNGLSRFNTDSEAFTNYYEQDGLKSNQFYWNAAARLADGCVCFGSIEGLSVIDPAACSEWQMASDLHFSHLEAGGKLCYSAISGAWRIHENDRVIRFSFSDLLYEPVSSVSYSYRLLGQDNDWIEIPGHRNTLAYSSLPPGNYELEVRAVDESGNVLDSCSQSIKVVPSFRHTLGFKILIFMVCLSLVLLFFWSRYRFLLRQKETLQGMVEERTREISQQKKLLEQKAEELDSQNKILKRQIEDLAGNKLLIAQDIQTSETPRDEQFVNKVLEVMRDNYKNPDLDVAIFCDAMGMSKTLLNKRLQETLGHSIVGLIRTYRLSVAHEMLVNNKETGKLNISEVAYESGFNDPKYFTRCFTKEYGISPSNV